MFGASSTTSTCGIRSLSVITVAHSVAWPGLGTAPPIMPNEGCSGYCGRRGPAYPPGGRAKMSRASLGPLNTGPPTQTGSPTASADWLILPLLSLTTVVLTSCQAQLLPSAALTTMEVPLLTASVTPRQEASVRTEHA